MFRFSRVYLVCLLALLWLPVGAAQASTTQTQINESCSQRPSQSGFYRDRYGQSVAYTYEPAQVTPKQGRQTPVLVLLPGAAWAVAQSPFYARNARLQQAWLPLAIYRLELGNWQPSYYQPEYPRQRDQVVDFILQLKAKHSSVCLLGQSTGAFLATAAAQALPGQLACLVLDSGIYDFQTPTDLPELAKPLFQAQIEAQVKLDAGLISSPTLLSYSQQDKWVNPRQSLEFGHDLFNLLPDLSINGDIELVVRSGQHIDEIFGGCDPLYQDEQNPLLHFVLRYLMPSAEKG